ncbi:myoD family inhibitor domain-containing protein isoform X3 [Oncorhynchus nerka]|uniref:myoD family inhibitor domain-containing protein isoform X3 n=1 Tax=Oncorhynchus nerka TaxID=8023 RepID=UPI0031B88F49
MELLQQGRTGETVISQDRVKGQEVAKCPLDLPEYQTTQPQPQPLPNVFTQQPLSNGTAGEHTAELPGPSVRSARADGEDSDDSMTDHNTTDDASHLLPNSIPSNPHHLPRVELPSGVPVSSSPKTSPKTLINGASPSPVCTPPSASLNQRGWSPPQSPQSPACDRHHGHPIKKQHLPSTTRSQNSLKADATQIKEIAGDAELPGPSVRSARADGEDSDDSMTDHNTTDDASHLLPNSIPSNPHHLPRELPSGVPVSSSPKTSPKTLINGASPSPVCTPPSASLNQRGWSPPQSPQSPACDRHHGHPIKKQHLPSTTRSQNSLKADATQIKEIAGDDCCVHCVLACLFCEVLSLCSVLAQCLACGEGCEVLCCCGEGAAGGLACGEDACSALLDCGILEDCCESSDCLEVCLECCSICFPV